jgi:hypothetical protein
MPVTIILATAALLRIQLDQGINTHNGHTCLYRGLQLLHLAHTRLEDTSLEAVVHFAVGQVQAVVLVVLRLRQLLGVLRGGVGRVNGTL